MPESFSCGTTKKSLIGVGVKEDAPLLVRMKLCSSFLLFVVPTLPLVGSAQGGKHLFILSGQSNMVGLDPVLSFTPAFKKGFGEEKVMVVHHAEGGNRWPSGIRRGKPQWSKSPGTNSAS